ncbi:hypothetical protein GCM10007100_39710 [Roseibacillus persicicus]|uniref:Thioredoxin domain-containing protein n=2 Tax=Roseibacillus persicicus TaxID=454148 RepID=A0A918TXP4_9BACT|nr:hypothetical protein GCM10007100_39710 [Roseibacillus persicicus]
MPRKLRSIAVMKNKFLAAIGYFGALVTSTQAELTWLTDFEAGKKQAAETGKTLLVDFTGSDWCHWCIQLDKEVFSQEAFEPVAEEYVLVELDFPQDETLITPEQRGKNEALAEKIGIEGFPSVILFDAKGRPFARTGYQEGGPEAYLKHLAELSKPYNALKGAEGDARKDALAGFLKTIPGREIEESYREEFAELKKLDPKDETGLLAELETAKAMAEFEDSVEQNLSAGDFDAVITNVDDFLAKHDPQGEKRQHVLMGKVMVYVEQGDTKKAFAQLDEMAGFAPESEFSRNLDEIKKSITEHLKMREEMEKEAEAELPVEAPEPSVVEEAEAAEKE